MWAPLGRKKQLPGLTSLKKNSSWSYAKKNMTFNTRIHFFEHCFLLFFSSLRFRFTVPMRLWSLLLASSCSLSHSCLSFSPGKATPRRRIQPEDSVWLARVTDVSWDVTDTKWGEVGERKEGKSNEQKKRWQQRKGEWGSARRGRQTARLMDGSVFVRTENRKPASDKHNILLLIFPAWLPWNPGLPNGSPVWKLLLLPGSI